MALKIVFMNYHRLSFFFLDKIEVQVNKVIPNDNNSKVINAGCVDNIVPRLHVPEETCLCKLRFYILFSYIIDYLLNFFE